MQKSINRAGWLVAGVLALFVVAALTGVVSGGPLDPPGPPASSGSVRLPGTPIDPPSSPASYPVVISSPGHYYLTGNLNPPASIRAITISSSDVSLDLGGFTLTGAGSSATGILLFGVHQRVQITNGFIRGFLGNGISAAGTPHVVIDGVTVTESSVGITMGSYSVLRNCDSSSNTETGVLISGSDSTIDNCIIASNGFLGVSLQNGGGVVVQRSNISNNNTSGLSEGGITFNAMDGATIRDNDFWANITRDVLLNSFSDNNVFLNNTFDCPTAFTNSGSGNFLAVNTTDPGANRTHKATC